MLADIFGKSAIPWGVRCPRLLSSWCVGSEAVCSNRCPGHGAFLCVIFSYRRLLTMGVKASDGTRFGRWPRCRGVRTCLDHSNIPKKMPLAPTHPAMARGCALSTRIVEILSAAPSTTEVHAEHGSSWKLQVKVLES